MMAADFKEPKVLIVLPTLEAGGAERLNVDLAVALRAKGIHTDICLIERMAGPLVEEARAAGVGVLDATTGSPRLDNWRSRRILWLLSVVHSVLRIARISRRYDVVMAGLDFMPVLTLWAAGWLVRRPIVAQSHCMVAEMVLEYPVIQKELPLLRRAYRRVVRLVGVSAAVLESASETLGVPRERGLVIANGIDFARVDALAEQAPRVPLPEDLPIVVAVGMLRPEKNQSLLIRAHALALAVGPAHHLVLLGEGRVRPELERLVEELGVTESVHLPGATDNPFAVMRRASLLCLSSDHEGSPLVLLEALALGCPVLSTRCSPEVEATLRQGEFGRLVAPGDDGQMAEAIAGHLSQPRELLERASRGASVVRSAYSIERTAEEYAVALRHAVGGRRRLLAKSTGRA